MTIPDRRFLDRHGPLAFAIVGAIVIVALGVTAIDATAAMAVVPSVALSLAGMHGLREHARRKREEAQNGAPKTP